MEFFPNKTDLCCSWCKVVVTPLIASFCTFFSVLASIDIRFPAFIQVMSKITICFRFQWFLQKMYSNQHFFLISTHNSYCSLENCKYHILLIGSTFDQISQRLRNFLFTYQTIDCLYTLYKFRFYSNVISSTGEVFNQLDRAVHHNLKWKGAEKMLKFPKKRLLRQKFKRHYLCSNQKLACTQTIGSAFLERVHKVQNSKYEHDLLKIIDCFFDGYGFVNSDHNIFSIKNLW